MGLSSDVNHYVQLSDTLLLFRSASLDADSKLSLGLGWLLGSLATRHVSLRAEPDFVLSQVRRLTEWGGSETFALHAEDGRLLKLRVCTNTAACSRIVKFLSALNAAQHPAFPTLVDSSQFAVLTDFIIGEPFCSVSISRQNAAIASTAMALARLHEIIPNQDARYSITPPTSACTAQSQSPTATDRYLCFSADANNIIVDANGAVFFIDLEAVAIGSRWVDIAWADDLLCTSDRARAAFRATYTKATGLTWPADDQWIEYQRQYLDWVLVQLNASLVADRDHVNVSARIQQLRHRRRTLGAS